MKVTNFVVKSSEFTAYDIAAAYSALPDIKRQAADRISVPHKRAESVLAAYLCYFALLCGYTGDDLVLLSKGMLLDRLEDITRFACDSGWPVGEGGKPFPDGAAAGGGVRHISISHSGGYALAAVSDRPVGADVQVIPDNPDRLIRIAGRFHPEERAWIESVSAKNLPERFCRLWVSKESAMKLCGKGFGLSLSSFCILPGRCFLDGKPVDIAVKKIDNAYLANAQYIE